MKNWIFFPWIFFPFNLFFIFLYRYRINLIYNNQHYSIEYYILNSNRKTHNYIQIATLSERLTEILELSSAAIDVRHLSVHVPPTPKTYLPPTNHLSFFLIPKIPFEWTAFNDSTIHRTTFYKPSNSPFVFDPFVNIITLSVNKRYHRIQYAFFNRSSSMEKPKTSELDAPLHTIGFEFVDLTPQKVSGTLHLTQKCCQVTHQFLIFILPFITIISLSLWFLNVFIKKFQAFLFLRKKLLIMNDLILDVAAIWGASWRCISNDSRISCKYWSTYCFWVYKSCRNST